MKLPSDRSFYPSNQWELVLKFLLLLAVLFAADMRLRAQGITTTQNSNSQALSQLLAGPGVTISNYSLTCAANGSGTFNNVSSNLGINGGVVLSTGRVQNIPQAANVFASTQFTASGDAQLSTLSTGTIYDPCILEFDVISQGPLLKFEYVFASEEYPEWVCSQYNDVFGFFISGPNPGGGNYVNSNIAIIPGTNLPVAINTINPGVPGANAGGGNCSGAQRSLAYSSLYTNNLSPVNVNIVYDGMTHVLTATASVVPCQTYHLKIAIADVGDRIYDSGVFLSAYSFTSNPISVSATSQLNYAGFSSAYEGCVGGSFTFTLSQVQPVDVHIPLSVTGTATNGVDYDSIPSVVIVPAGQTSITVALNALVDGISELSETVTVSVVDPCTGLPSSSATITIQDDVPATITVADSMLCLGESTQLNANGGLTYAWSPATGLSNTTIRNPVATPTVTTTYTVSMTWGACTKTAQVTVYVSNPSTTVSANPAGTVCNGGTVQLTAMPINGALPYNYLWSNGATAPYITVVSGGTYTATVTDAYGCSASASQVVTISNLGITGVASNVSCLGGSNGAIDITVTGTHAPFTYSWTGGVTSQDRTNLTVGTYSVTVSNTVGCSVTASYTITQPASALTTSATNTPVSCNAGSNGSINLTVNGGVSPYSFLWSNTATTEDLNNITAGSYSVTVTDFNGCTASRTVNVTQPTAITTSESHVNAICYGGNTGSIDLSVSGGVGTYTYIWNDGETTQDISSLTAGTYSVTVADANSCVATRSVIITQPSEIVVVNAVTHAGCFGAATGAVNTTVTGGTSPYTYAWSNGATSQNISSLTAGAYTLTVTDNNLCSVTATNTLTQPAALIASTTQTNVTCNGGNDGTINLNVSGGTTPYSFNWSGGATTQNRTNVSAGTHTVTVTDNAGCSVTANAIITQPTALTINNVSSPVSCFGGSNGSINITVSGSVSPYSYNWGGGITTEDRTNLTAGTYTVTATDTRGCSITTSVAITQPAVLSFNESHTDVTCFGANTGSINVTISGGTSPYTYNWGGGVTSEDRTNLIAGTYNVTSTDSRGCSVSGSVAITQPTAITVSQVVTDATCAPGDNGAIDITVTGGTSPYSFNWGGGITSEDRTSLFAGTYTVTITDNSACTVTRAISVSQIGTGITLTASNTNVTCFGGNDGAIDVSISGGTAPYTYNWGGGITSEDRTALSTGSYSVTVTDGLGCSAVASSLITQPAAIAISVTKTDVRCFGESTGSILIAVSGGTGAYTYNWSDGATSQNRTNITAGSYTLVVNDANACSATAASIIVEQPATAVILSFTSSNVSCFGENNGMVDLTVSGGTPGYTYVWSNGSISQDLTNVIAGSYSISVTDANSCSSSTSVIVTQPTPALSVVLSPTHLTCNGISTGAITTTASGGTPSYTYNWGGGNTAQDRSSLAAGTYTITVTDNNGCTTTASTIISQPSPIQINLTKTDVSCSGGSDGSITLNPTGGTGSFTFDWSGGITTQNRTGLVSGAYSVTVVDANLCSASAATTVTEPAPLAISINTGTSVCLSPTGTVNAIMNGSGTPPYSYLWSNGATTQQQNGLPTGPMSVTVTDSRGCSITGSVSVGVSGNNTDAAFAVTGNHCGPDATLTFTHSGSNNITAHYWDFGNGLGLSTQNNPSYNYPAAGNFTVTHIVFRGFCSDTVTHPLTVFQKPILSAVATNVSCNGLNNGAIDLTATGTPSFSYNWGGGITTEDRSGLAPGTYMVTVTDPNTCSSTMSFSITQPNALTVANNNTNVSCNGGNNGAINLTVVGGTPAYTYNWGGGITTQNRTGLSGGLYTVTVSDANACTSVNAISLHQPNAISISTNVVNPACNGQTNGSIQLTVTGGTGAYSYNWGGGVTTQNRTNIPAETYSVTVTDANACIASLSVVVSQPAILTATLSTTNALCFGANNGSIIINTTGGTSPYNYTWNDGSNNSNRSSLFAGAYSVTVVDQNACSVSTSTVVTQPVPGITVQVDEVEHVACYGNNTGVIKVTASGSIPPYTYQWSDGSLNEDRNNVLAGTYFVSAIDQNGCFATATAIINQPSAPLAIDTIEIADALCKGSNTGALVTNVSGGTIPYSYHWSDDIHVQNRTGLPAGTYQLTVTDANACTTANVAVIKEPDSIIITPTVIHGTCFGGNSGSINLAVSGGIEPYAYNWGGGITTQNRSTLTAGIYNVVVTDSNACNDSMAITLNQPTAISPSTTTTTVSCFGGSNGTVNLTTTGGTTPYTYNWGGGVTTQNRTNLSAGNYGVTITDANACSTTSSAVITQPAAALSASTTTNAVSCFGGNNGAIILTTTGGTTPYTYNWGGGVTTQNRTNLTAGTYNVTITDGNACSTTSNAVIIQPAAALSASTTTTTVSCFGGNNGAINLTITGGTTPYIYNWGGGVATQNRTNLSAANYGVTITDANACSTTSSAVITQPAAALSPSTITNAVSCFGGNNGTINLTTTGGTTPYTYNWGGGVTTQNRTNLSAGTYGVTITDANACSTTSSAVITQPAATLSASTTVNAVSCFGGTNGAINLTTTGGTTPYTYNWGGGATTQNRTNLSAGTYGVTITDANACSMQVSSVVNQPSDFVITHTPTNVSCNGASDGNINLNVSGATPGYTFVWSNGATTEDVTNLIAGNYTVTVRDANSCSSNTTITITQPTIISVLETHTAVSCNGGSNGSINITINGGVAPYNFVWNDGATTEDRNNIAAGTYQLIVNDNNSCAVSQPIIITQPVGLSISFNTTNVLCNGNNTGSIASVVTGGTAGYSYLWSNGVSASTITNLTAGTYQLTITDANACTATSSANISEPVDALSISSSISNVACFGNSNGAINLFVTGGTPAYTYNWGGGITTQNRSNLAAGTYRVTVTDANACNTTASIIVNQPAASLNASTVVNVVSCFAGNDGAITVNAAGGTSPYFYNWGGGINTQNRTGLSAGTYTVTVTDMRSCSAIATAIVTQPTAPLAASTSVNHVSCYAGTNGSITLSVSGGTPSYTYNWGGGVTSQNRTGLSAGSYQVTITDNKSCSATASAVITQPATPLTASTSSTNVACYGATTGSIYLTANGGTPAYTYNWGGGVTSQNRTALPAGNYTVTVSDSKFCTATSSVIIAQPTAPLTSSSSVTDVTCHGEATGTVTLNVAGGTSGYSYYWSDGATLQNRSLMTAGNYVITVVDANSCSLTNNVIINQPAELSASLVATPVRCHGETNGSVDLTVQGGVAPYAFMWNNNATTEDISALAADNYSVSVSDANACATNRSATVDEPNPLQISFSATDVACAGTYSGRVDVTVSGGTLPYHYQWSNFSSTEDLLNASAGNYTLTVTDKNGCYRQINAVINTLPQLDVTGTTNPLPCIDATGNIDLSVNSGTPPFTFQWSNGAATEDLTDVHPGVYSVIVRDANGCPFDTIFEIENLNTFVVDATGGGTVKLGEFVDLHVTSTGSSQTVFSWSPVFGMDCHTCADVTVQPGHPTVYTVVGIDTNGCIARDTVSVDVMDDYTIFTPNAFTPNGDGNNDYFQIFGNLEGIRKFDFMVFDRWGEKVYEANQADFKWDGVYKGELLPPAVYVYIMKIVFLDGHNNKIYKGSLTIIR